MSNLAKHFGINVIDILQEELSREINNEVIRELARAAMRSQPIKPAVDVIPELTGWATFDNSTPESLIAIQKVIRGQVGKEGFYLIFDIYDDALLWVMTHSGEDHASDG